MFINLEVSQSFHLFSPALAAFTEPELGFIFCSMFYFDGLHVDSDGDKLHFQICSWSVLS